MLWACVEKRRRVKGMEVHDERKVEEVVGHSLLRHCASFRRLHYYSPSHQILLHQVTRIVRLERNRKTCECEHT